MVRAKHNVYHRICLFITGNPWRAIQVNKTLTAWARGNEACKYCWDDIYCYEKGIGV